MRICAHDRVKKKGFPRKKYHENHRFNRYFKNATLNNLTFHNDKLHSAFICVIFVKLLATNSLFQINFINSFFKLEIHKKPMICILHIMGFSILFVIFYRVNYATFSAFTIMSGALKRSCDAISCSSYAPRLNVSCITESTAALVRSNASTGV